MEVKRRNIAFAILIGIGIFLVFSSQVGLERTWSLVSGSQKSLLLLVIILNLANLIAFTLSWRSLILVKIGFYRLFKFFMIGVFINNITPTFGTGGEPVKAVLLGKETGISKSEGFASVVSQRMLNMLPFVLIAIFGLATLATRPGMKALEILILGSSLTASIGFFLLIIYIYVKKEKLFSITHKIIRKLTPIIRSFKRGFDYDTYIIEVDESINAFHSELRNISRNKNGLAKAIAYSFLGWGFDVAAAYTVFLAIGYPNIHIGVLIITYTIAMAAGLVPLFLPGGLGIVDGTMALLYISNGVPPDIAILATLLYRLVAYWLNTLIGAIYLGRW